MKTCITAAIVALSLSAGMAHATFVEGTPCNCDFDAQGPMHRPAYMNDNGIPGIMEGLVRAIYSITVIRDTDLARTVGHNDAVRAAALRAYRSGTDMPEVKMRAIGFSQGPGYKPFAVGIGGNTYSVRTGEKIGEYTGGDVPAANPRPGQPNVKRTSNKPSSNTSRGGKSRKAK
jgi:hypothetical protein